MIARTDHRVSAARPAALGWLDGFSDAALDGAGHHCVAVGGFYALVWPAAHQGGLKAAAGRVLQAGLDGAILPARCGQRVQSAASLRVQLRAESAALRQSLHRLGRQRQYTIILPFCAPTRAESTAGLRAKFAARTHWRRCVDDKLKILAPFLSGLQGHISAQTPPTPLAADKVGIHLSIAQDADGAVQSNWQRCVPRHCQAALIGPLPPYAFVQHSFSAAPGHRAA